MKTTITRLLLLLALCAPLLAHADCIYSGQSYRTGTRLGNLTCQSDGQWR